MTERKPRDTNKRKFGENPLEECAAGQIKINHIFFLLDDSGSMNHLRVPTVDNFNETVQALKAEAVSDQANLVSLIKFGSKASTVREPTSLQDFEELTIDEYNPNSMTALYDGLGYTIGQAKASFAKYGNFDNAAIIFVLTDGGENASKEFDNPKIQSMIKELQDEGRFTFTFMGCTEELALAAKQLGIYDGNITLWQHDEVGLNNLTVQNAASTKALFAARSAGMTACSGFYSHEGYVAAQE